MDPVIAQAISTLVGALAMVLLAIAGWINTQAQARRRRRRAEPPDEPDIEEA